VVGCAATYSLVFVVGNAPGGFVAVDYIWHVANGSTTPPRSVRLKNGSSQPVTYPVNAGNGTTPVNVYVTWSADGISNSSNVIQVTFLCTT
jgi:hypothetical protein